MKKKRENQNKKKEIIIKYNSTSDYYERRYKEIQYNKYKIVLKSYAVGGKIILDAGCGTGLLYDFLINSLERIKTPFYSYIAIDISINMLKIFKLKNLNKDKKIGNKLNLILCDLENLPIRSNIFNSFFSLTSLQNLPHIVDGVKEMLRVVKDNADIKFSILNKNIDLNKLISQLKSRIFELQILNNEIVEDVIIQGKKLKN
ncbi:MAG: class I SAM-dependent methyltransferase [Candidatus Hodarchaeota archaeon]